MYKNLNALSLGLGGRIHELIELALSDKFAGFDIDMGALAKQVELQGFEGATRFLTGAKIRIGGFELGPDWYGTEEEFQAELALLERFAPVAKALGADRCLANLAPYNDAQAYQETFGLHVARIGQIAAVLKPHDIRLGLGFLAPAEHRTGHASQFIATAEGMIAMLKMVSNDQVGLCLDLWEWTVGGGTLEMLKSLPVSRVVAVRLADLPEGLDPAEANESQRLLPGTTDPELSVSVLQWLMDGQYDGPVTAYAHADQFAGQKRPAVVARASASLDQLLSRVTGAELSDAEAEAAATR